MIGLSKVQIFSSKGLNNKEDSVEYYNACNMFLCKFCCTGSYLCLLQIALLAKALYREGILLMHPKYLSQPLCHLCPPYLPILHGIFRHSKVNCLSATFKQFKMLLNLCQCFIAHEEVCGVLSFNLVGQLSPMDQWLHPLIQ